MKTRTTITLSFLAIMLISLSYTASGNSGSATLKPVSPWADATINFQFDGLMAICFGNPERVSAGLLDVHHHSPEIKIMRIKDGQRAELATLKEEQLRNTLYIDVEGSSRTGVSRYYTESMDDVKDFRWNLDLEGELHQRQLYVREDKLFGKIHFNSGLFYAGKMTEQPVRFFAADNSGKTLPFNRRIAAPAAKINLAIGEALVIRGGKETIRLVAEAGVRYEVEVNNLPPPDMANMDHWLFYYDVINTKVTRYMPVQTVKTAFGPRPLLCEPAVFSRSRLN
jgi:hypothetical protein